MTHKPRIGILLPTSVDSEYNRRCWPEYAEAVTAAGGKAVPLSLGERSILLSQLEACSGFVLPGSPADVDPDGYGHERDPMTAIPDAKREVADRALLEHAAATGKPVLGICFGLQSVNVLLGGTLVQDLQPIPVNHAAGPSVAVAHAVLVSRESMLGSLLGPSEASSEGEFCRLLVNSSHHQAIGIAGDGLTVTARSAQDGVVEGAECQIGRSAFLGVQWHPERSYAISGASRALFFWLVAEAMDRLQGSEVPSEVDID